MIALNSVFRLVFVSVLASLLVACGGGSDPVSSEPVPIIVMPPPDVSISANAASKFLTQTSYGPTLTDINKLSELGYEAWLNEQFTLPISSHYNYLQGLPEITSAEQVKTWLAMSVTSEDQLRQRIAFALSEIWVVSYHGVDFPSKEIAAGALTSYYDLLLNNAFGNYRNLMEELTLNPVMGEYLSMKGNQKADLAKNILPDENYAREMMQLFTIGLHELNMDGSQKLDTQGSAIPTYTQDTIEEMARVFTGWHFANALSLANGTNDDPDFITRMAVIEDFHDRGEKTVLGGLIIPAQQSAEEDMQAILDIVFNHPNVAPFVSKQLIQKLVTSNPSSAYIERVANVFANNGSGIRGDMQSVVAAILLDDEALTRTTSSDKVFGKLKEPIVRMVGIWRTFNASALSGRYSLTWFTEFMGQSPLGAHHVFNFFSPSFTPQGSFQENGWVAPEFEIHTEANMTKMINFYQRMTFSQNNIHKTNPDRDEILLNLTYEATLVSNVDALLDHYNLLLFAGEMSSELRTITQNYISTLTNDKEPDRAYEALGVLVAAPEFLVQD
ncbi:MAG: hypothetical protein ACI9VT_001996 [Psychroserpens sp.]|jgi:uncharacterized protein (DUF1800 family)